LTKADGGHRFVIRDSKNHLPELDYTKNCTFEPVLGGSQGQEVTKAFDRVIAG
jgi:hypothetical protein